MADRLKEYVIPVKPQVDTAAWQQASDTIATVLRSPLQAVNDVADKIFNSFRGKAATLQDRNKQEGVYSLDEQFKAIQERIAKAQASDDQKELIAAQKQFEKLGGATKQAEITSRIAEAQQAAEMANRFSQGISLATSAVTLFTVAIKKAKDITERATDVSSQFVSQSSINVDESVRSAMIRYGTDSTTAQSIVSASEALNLDLSNYSKWTRAQREGFNSLMKTYKEGLDSINPDKLKQYNKAVQEYELTRAEFDMKIQLAWTKVLASSDAVPQLLETFERGMDSITNLLSSDAFRTGFEMFTSIINGIIKIVTMPLNLLGDLFTLGSSRNTTTTTTTNNNTIYATSTDSKDLAIDIGLQLQGVLG